MISRYRASLGGVQLDSLDDNIRILDIAYQPMEKQVNRHKTSDFDGFDISGETFQGQSVTVVLEAHIYDTEKRNEAIQKINKWAAAGGTLVTSDRKNQFLTVRCARFAAVESVKKWTDPVRLIFETTTRPYWESSAQKVTTLSGANASGTLAVDGNTGKAMVGVEMTANAAISAVKFTVGDTAIDIAGLSMTSGQKLILDYLEGRYLRVRANGSSVMNKIIPENSTDLLLADCGKSTAVKVFANARVTTKFLARGLWL